MNVLATVGSDDGKELVESQARITGADKSHRLGVFNHNKEGYLEECMAYTRGQGVDVIIEMLANVNLGNDLPLLKKVGSIVIW